MFHLSSERIAALIDDEPSAVEALHLASCQVCASERRAQQRLHSASAKMSVEEVVPLTQWANLSRRLESEGLLRTPSHLSPVRGRVVRAAGLLAASLALLVGGTVIGRMSAGMPLSGAVGIAARAAQPVGDGTTQYASTAEALDVFLRARREYQEAAAFLNAREASGDVSRDAMLTRLAALDEIHAASVAALRDSPTDPIINDYYVSTLGARDAAIRQLNAALPSGARVRRY